MVKVDGLVEKAYRHFYQHGALAYMLGCLDCCVMSVQLRPSKVVCFKKKFKNK